jgi:cytoskeleton protein RodZ
MGNEGRERVPFDEKAALEELQRFKEGIARYRAQRAARGDQFEIFVRSLKTGRAEGGANTDANQPPAQAAQTVPLPAGPPAPADLPARRETDFAPVVSHEVATEPAQATPVESVRTPPRRRSSSSTPAVLGGALIVLVAGGLLVKTLRDRAPESTPAPANTPETPVEPAPAAAPPPVPAAAATVATSESAITTTRRVWVRVTVDGVRFLEREVAAGTRLPLNAEKTIVIRTGDAGAVRLSIRGQDYGFLGVEGEVVTRSFAVPPITSRR